MSQIEAIEIAYPVDAVGGYVIEVYNGTDPIAANFSFFFSVIEGLP